MLVLGKHCNKSPELLNNSHLFSPCCPQRPRLLPEVCASPAPALVLLRDGKPGRVPSAGDQQGPVLRRLQLPAGWADRHHHRLPDLRHRCHCGSHHADLFWGPSGKTKQWLYGWALPPKMGELPDFSSWSAVQQEEYWEAIAGVGEALSAKSDPGSTPDWLESLFLHLEVVLGEPSQTLRACHMARVCGAVSGKFGGAAGWEQRTPLL